MPGILGQTEKHPRSPPTPPKLVGASTVLTAQEISVSVGAAAKVLEKE